MTRIFGLTAAAILLAALIVVPANAMENIHAGIRGGMNVANVNVDPEDSEQADSRNGLALGGFVAIPVNEMFSVQPEALFMMKGDEEQADGTTETLKLNYIEIPVLAKVSFMPQAAANPTLFLGPSVGFNTTAKVKMEGEGIEGAELDVKDNTKSVDFGFVFGGGLDIPVGDKGQTVGFDVRYTLGLTDINDTEGTAPEAKTGTLTVMGSFGFI